MSALGLGGKLNVVPFACCPTSGPDPWTEFFPGTRESKPQFLFGCDDQRCENVFPVL